MKTEMKTEIKNTTTSIDELISSVDTTKNVPETQYIEDNEIRDALNFAKRIISIEIELKNLKEDIKSIKKEAKDDGILIKEVIQAINMIKKNLKKVKNKDTETILDALTNDVEIMYSIQSLMR